jgi:EAL domain-containing protein (putative c-di-GMP-specific phosphodiesterase class I)
VPSVVSISTPTSIPRGRCAVCETLPTAPSGAGRLHLWLPNPHALGKAQARVRALGLDATTERNAHALTVQVVADVLPALVGTLGGALSTLEVDDSRALFVPGDAPLAAEHVAQVTSLARLQALVEGTWLVTLLEEEDRGGGRLASHFQPIVRGDDPSCVVGHEALLRGTAPDGTTIPPQSLFEGARRAGLLFQLDLAARRAHIRNAARAGAEGLLFLNFAPTAIYDPTTCLRSTVAAIDAAGIAHERVVFEIVESEGMTDTAHLRRILDYYRSAGFRVALDDVGSGYSSLNRLHLLRPDLLKLDMELVRDVHADPYKAVVTEKVFDLAHSLGIPVLAEGVETAEELAWMQARGVAYVQGYLTGRPAPVPRAASAWATGELASWRALASDPADAAQRAVA